MDECDLKCVEGFNASIQAALSSRPELVKLVEIAWVEFCDEDYGRTIRPMLKIEMHNPPVAQAITEAE